MADDPDLQHALFLRTFDEKLGFAPPNDPDADVKNVLDIDRKSTRLNSSHSENLVCRLLL